MLKLRWWYSGFNNEAWLQTHPLATEVGHVQLVSKQWVAKYRGDYLGIYRSERGAKMAVRAAERRRIKAAYEYKK